MSTGTVAVSTPAQLDISPHLPRISGPYDKESSGMSGHIVKNDNLKGAYSDIEDFRKP